MYNLTDTQVIKSILGSADFRFSKSLGQNFITDPEICPRMAGECGADKGSLVVEIGPGIGVLTQELCLTAKKVVAIELDKRLLPILDKTLADFDNVKIINDDIMKLDLKKLIERESDGGDVYVCANLPYYITSPVIMMLLQSKLPIKAVTVMIQKEVADRLCAPVGSREAGAVTAAAAYYSEVGRLFDVPKTSFMPSPKVDSCVIRMDIRKSPPVSVKDESLFFDVIKAAFGQRRKTAVNSLSAGLGISKETVSRILGLCGFEPSVRAETMELKNFALISDLIFDSSSK